MHVLVGRFSEGCVAPERYNGCRLQVPFHPMLTLAVSWLRPSCSHDGSIDLYNILQTFLFETSPEYVWGLIRSLVSYAT